MQFQALCGCSSAQVDVWCTALTWHYAPVLLQGVQLLQLIQAIRIRLQKGVLTGLTSAVREEEDEVRALLAELPASRLQQAPQLQQALQELRVEASGQQQPGGEFLAGGLQGLGPRQGPSPSFEDRRSEYFANQSDRQLVLQQRQNYIQEEDEPAEGAADGFNPGDFRSPGAVPAASSYTHEHMRLMCSHFLAWGTLQLVLPWEEADLPLVSGTRWLRQLRRSKRWWRVPGRGPMTD
jgi:hypothetical protein